MHVANNCAIWNAISDVSSNGNWRIGIVGGVMFVGYECSAL